MKKKRFLLSLFLILSIFCFAACKKDPGTPTTPETPPPAVTPGEPSTPTGPVDPTLNVTVLDQKYYVGDLLSTVGIYLTAGDSEGTVAWDNPNYVLVLGENLCAWTFTPDDEDAFYTKSGTKVVTAINRAIVPEIEVSVEDRTFYEGEKLSSVELSYTPNTIEGTLEWTTPNAVLEVGTNEFDWKFTPADQSSYEIVTGSVQFEAVNQVLTSVNIKTNPTKLTGYSAFETFDATGLTLELVYNKGKTETVTTGWEISYNTDNRLLAGDNTISIEYEGFTCTIEVDDVSKLTVAEPTFRTETYKNGDELPLVVETNNSTDFEIDNSQTYINAGTYMVNVSLVDPANYEWVTEENKSKQTIQVPFVVNKIDLVVTENDYNAQYDGKPHAATVEANGAEVIYYSTAVLNKDNYSKVGSTALIEYTDVIADVVVYYYIVGDINHFDASGSLSVNIRKQQARFASNYCYAVQTGDVINYPEQYIELIGANGEKVEMSSAPTLTYYADYANRTLTNKINHGSSFAGGAPSEPCDGTPYSILIEYSDENYNASTVVELYIEYDDTMFYATKKEAAFAFRQKTSEEKSEEFLKQVEKELEGGEKVLVNPDTAPLGLYGSVGLCTHYAEFRLQENTELGITEIACNFKMGAGIENNKTGVIIFKDGGYLLVDSEGNSTPVVVDEEQKTITITSEDVLLEKWVIPDYLGTYSGQTIADGDTQEDGSEYANKYSSVRIYNDYGTLRFELNYNLAVVKVEITIPGVPAEVYGGSGRMTGVVEYNGIKNVSGLKQELVFFEASGEYNKNEISLFYLRWVAYTGSSTDTPLVKDPQSMVFEGNRIDTKLSLSTLDDKGHLTLDVTYTKQV